MNQRVRRDESERFAEEVATPSRDAGGRAPADVLALQRGAGNQAVARLLERRAASARVQRLVGIEVELAVPTFAAGAVVPNPGPGGAAQPVIGDFFGGGLVGGASFGQIPAGGGIDLKPDHSKKLHGPGRRMYGALAARNHGGHPLLPGGYRALSNLEYSTPALDEIAPGSNAQFQAQTQAIDNHAQALLAQNPAGTVNPIQHGGGVRVGVPVAPLQAWLGPIAADPAYTAALNDLQANVQWSMYVQATVGVLPSGMPSLYQAHQPPAHAASPKADVRRATIAGVQGLLADPGFQAQIQQWQLNAGINLAAIDRDALSGVLHLGLSYAIGSAYNQTNLANAVNKNAVDLLLKLDDIAGAAPAMTPLVTAHPPPAALTNYAGQWFHANVPQTNVGYWLLAHHAALGTSGERVPAYGQAYNPAQTAPVNAANAVADTQSMLLRLLTGAGGIDVDIGPGTALPAPDVPSPTLPPASVGGQGGVPLEYRWITQRPNAAGQLWNVLQTVLVEVRDANLAQVPAINQPPIRNAW